jgi:hypothetical protein
MVNAILNDINAGLPDGNRYTSAAAATEQAAWRVVTKHVPDKRGRRRPENDRIVESVRPVD